MAEQPSWLYPDASTDTKSPTTPFKIESKPPFEASSPNKSSQLPKLAPADPTSSTTSLISNPPPPYTPRNDPQRPSIILYCSTCHHKIDPPFFHEHVKHTRPKKPFDPHWAYTHRPSATGELIVCSGAIQRNNASHTDGLLDPQYRSWVRINSAACPYCDATARALATNTGYNLGMNLRKRKLDMEREGQAVRMTDDERKVFSEAEKHSHWKGGKGRGS